MRTKVFYGILVVLMGSLILFGKCRAAWEVDVSPMAQGELIWPSEETTAEYTYPIYPIHRGSVTVIPDDITALLRECLEFIEDGSVDQNRALQAAIYRPLTRDGVAQDEADRAQREAERYRRETALHGKIKEMITKLEGRTK